MMKKLILILILWLAGCNNNWKLIMDNWELTGKTTLQVNTGWQDNEIVGSEEQEIKNKNIIWKSSEISKELDREFSDIYSPEDSNHYENSCYLLLDTDYQNKQFVLYRNKWAWVGTWWCKLDWVEKIWVLWYYNWKPDPDGEYFLKSYNLEIGLFKYVMSEKYWNLWDLGNEYEFRFYMKDGKVIKEKINKNINPRILEKAKVAEIIKEKCGLDNFSVSKIPTKKWETISLLCEDGDWLLTYNWNNEYILGIEWFKMPMYSVYIKNWKIIKEWHEICWKLFKSMDDFYNLTGELAVWDLRNNKCKFVSTKRYSGYYSQWYFVALSWGNEVDYSNPKCTLYDWEFVISHISWSIVYLQKSLPPYNDNEIYKAKIKVFNTKYWKSFLLYSWWQVFIIWPNKECDYDWVYYGLNKTFLNWKEVK